MVLVAVPCKENELTMNLPSSVLNLALPTPKINGSVFLEGERGLVDSINRPHQEIFDLYKKLKKLDWDEHEFELEKCVNEFKTKPEHLSFKMIQTLAFQWEADSSASNTIVPMAAPFVSDSDLWLAYQRIGENEGLHGLAYSEIVKYGMDDATKAMMEVVQNRYAANRLRVVAEAFADVQKIGNNIKSGVISRNSDEARQGAMLFSTALMVLERIQFMISFATTFAIGEIDSFMPIVDTVQKIFTDEYTVHIPVGKYVIRNQIAIPSYKKATDDIWPIAEKMISEVLKSELDWNYNHLFADGQQLAGVTPKMFEDWALYAVNDVYELFGRSNPHRVVSKNPLPYMNDWSDINKNQGSPQEVRRGNYFLGGVVAGSSDEEIDITGLLD